MTDSYKQVIDILTTADVDYKAIALELAKDNPGMFLRYHNKKRFVPQWIKEVIDFLKNEKKVEAIRTLRAETKIGLKEAKDICDHLQNKLAKHGFCKFMPYDLNFLNSECETIYEKVVSFI